MALGKLWDQMESEQISFSLELINCNNNCVKTIFVCLYLFVRSQTSLDHLVLSSEARRYLTLTITSNNMHCQQHNAQVINLCITYQLEFL
jgi:hypothetical protein